MNKEWMLLIHPSVVRWDYFAYVIPLLESGYHLVIPALPGYDEEKPEMDFTSVEQIAEDLADWLISAGCCRLACAYGCSMGGAVVIKMLSDNRIPIGSAVIDGGIHLLEKAFSTDSYSKEDLQYIADVLKQMSSKTIWRTFESCNNYVLPEQIRTNCSRIEYWFAEAEEKERKWDMAFMRKAFPQTVFRRVRNLGHGGLAVLQPGKLAAGLRTISKKSNEI